MQYFQCVQNWQIGHDSSHNSCRTALSYISHHYRLKVSLSVLISAILPLYLLVSDRYQNLQYSTALNCTFASFSSLNNFLIFKFLVRCSEKTYIMFFERLKYSTLTYTFSTAGVQEIRFRQCKDKKSFELLMKLSRGFINLISSVCSDCLVFFLIAVVFVLLGFFVMLQPNIGNNTETLFFFLKRIDFFWLFVIYLEISLQLFALMFALVGFMFSNLCF